MKAKELQPDLLLLDLHLPDIDGFELAKQVQQIAPNTRIVFLTTNQEPDLAMMALFAGAKGYVCKNTAAKDLLPAITAALQNAQFVSPMVKIRPK